MKKMLAALDGVESAEGTASSVAQKGSMKSLLESLDSVMDGEITKDSVVANEGGMKNTVTDMQEHLHDFAQEIQRGMHGYDAVVDELNDLFDEVVEMGDPVVANAFKVLRTLEPEDFGEGEGGGPNRASIVAQDAMDMIDGSDDSDYDHLPKIGEAELEEAQSPAQKAAFEKMLAAKKGNKADDKDDDEDKDEVDESVEELEEAIMVSAEGAEAAELLAILKNAGMPAPAMPEPEMDMQDEYSNSPDEVEMDLDAVIASGDDMHREKDQFAAAADGDNPMKAFEGKLQAMLDEMLAEDGEVAEEVVAEETDEEVVAEETDEVVEADDQGLSRFLKIAGI